MKYRDFEELPIWQDARGLVKLVYKAARENDQLSRDFGLRDQIQRASVSIMNNIAEGFDAGSNKVFTRFLTYSIQSCSEVISLSYVLADVYQLEQLSQEIRSSAVSLRKQTKAFKRYLKSKN